MENTKMEVLKNIGLGFAIIATIATLVVLAGSLLIYILQFLAEFFVVVIILIVVVFVLGLSYEIGKAFRK
jgi:hypothetical protein